MANAGGWALDVEHKPDNFLGGYNKLSIKVYTDLT
jgi:hypothetical protein